MTKSETKKNIVAEESDTHVKIKIEQNKSKNVPILCSHPKNCHINSCTIIFKCSRFGHYNF